MCAFGWMGMKRNTHTRARDMCSPVFCPFLWLLVSCYLHLPLSNTPRTTIVTAIDLLRQDFLTTIETVEFEGTTEPACTGIFVSPYTFLSVVDSQGEEPQTFSVAAVGTDFDGPTRTISLSPAVWSSLFV